MNIKEYPKKYVDAIDSWDMDTLNAIVDDKVTMIGSIPSKLEGKEALWSYLKNLKSAMPDLKHTIKEVCAENDWVSAHYWLEGTQTGELNGIPASNNKVSFGGLGMLKVTDGKIVQLIVYFDGVSMLQQLGVMPK